MRTASYFDCLSLREVEFAMTIMDELQKAAWATPLISAIQTSGGMVYANKPKLFELRFAYALHRAGIVPQYEIPGEGHSTIDFGFTSACQIWRVELMRLEETNAARDATRTGTAEGIAWAERSLETNAADSRMSVEGETLKAVERICQKCERDGAPHKFTLPDGALHALLVDTSTLFDGADLYDYVHIALGTNYVTEPAARRYWLDKPITGVFDASTNLRGAAELRARVHFLGFVCEECHDAGEFAQVCTLVPNWDLLPSCDAVDRARETWPLRSGASNRVND